MRTHSITSNFIFLLLLLFHFCSDSDYTLCTIFHLTFFLIIFFLVLENGIKYRKNNEVELSVDVCDCQFGNRPNHVLIHYHFIRHNSSHERKHYDCLKRIQFYWWDKNHLFYSPTPSSLLSLSISFINNAHFYLIVCALQVNTRNSILQTVNCYLMSSIIKCITGITDVILWYGSVCAFVHCVLAVPQLWHIPTQTHTLCRIVVAYS